MRYIWQQKTHRVQRCGRFSSRSLRRSHRVAELFGCDREEIAITRGASVRARNASARPDLKSGDSPDNHAGLRPHADDDSPARATRRHQAELIRIPIPPKDINESHAAFETGDYAADAFDSEIAHQITPHRTDHARQSCLSKCRRHGEKRLSTARIHSAQFYFKQPDLDCDYFGTSLHKWLLRRRHWTAFC